MIDALAAPTAVGCALTGSRVFTGLRAALPLCLAADGGCFALAAPRPDPTRVTVTFPEGDVVHAGALVELDDGLVTTRGWTGAAAVPLSPRILFTLGTPRAAADFVAPVGDVLEVESAAQGTVSVVLRLGAGVAVEGGVARAERRCRELQVDPGSVEVGTLARFVAGKKLASGKQADVLPAGKDTPLASTPGETAVATLRADDETSAEVEVLERRGREARIFWLRAGYAVFGWVPAAALRKRAPLATLASLSGRDPKGPLGPQAQACREDVPLLVDVAGRIVEVGKVRRGTPILVTARRGGHAVVELQDPVAVLDHGAAWLLREADLARACAAR